MPVFKTGAINHSATSPELLQFYYSLQGCMKQVAFPAFRIAHDGQAFGITATLFTFHEYAFLGWWI